MIRLLPRPAAASFWHPNRGAWIPTHRRVTPPRRWLRYPLATILLASGLWFADPFLPAWGEATAPIGWHGPCHTTTRTLALPLFADAEGDRND